MLTEKKRPHVSHLQDFDRDLIVCISDMVALTASVKNVKLQKIKIFKRVEWLNNKSV